MNWHMLLETIAWILEERRRDASRSQSRLWKVSPDGKATAVHQFPETTIPLRIACIKGKPWVIVMNKDSTDSATEGEREVQQFDLDAAPSGTINIPARDMTVGAQSGSIWIQTKDQLLRVDHDGTTILTVPNSSESSSVQIHRQA